MLQTSAMVLRSFWLAKRPALATAASTSLQFVPPTSTGVLATGVLPLPGGSVGVYGVQTTPPCNASATAPEACHQIHPPLVLAVLDVSGNQTAALAASALGGGNSIIVSAAADANGNIWITGETDSDDFPLVHALYANKSAYHMTGFAVKLDPKFNILFSTFLGGQTVPSQAQSTPESIALDGTGNAYITGTTNDSAFPVTGPVLGSGTPSGNPLAPGSYAFVVKLASDGSKLLY